MQTSISNWPALERPREKLLAFGPETLSDAELLAVVLRSGVKGKSALTMARELLARFGGLRPLLAADCPTLCSALGVGPAKYALLQAALELARRRMAERLRRESSLTSPESARQYLRAWLQDRPCEVFCCLFLDTRHRVLKAEELFRGTIDGASVHPREVVRTALTHNAAAVIVAHNHPSGVAEPSRADELLTRRLKDALALVDIRLLDHIVVGEVHAVSLAERGLI